MTTTTNDMDAALDMVECLVTASMPGAPALSWSAMEGWGIFNCGTGKYQLQKIDEPMPPDMRTFPTDDDAIKHVVSKANAKSPVHYRALRFLARVDPSEYEYICTLTGYTG